ncbi:MAG: hypothetical protein H0U44_07200 [Flavisolibacter sp.]|jgi:hypothetical protein|nr:hypothetical protein [Flavisolibacter sp.]
MRDFKYFFILLFALQSFVAFAQQSEKKKRGTYALVAYVGGGVGYYLTLAGVPAYLNPQVSKWSSLTSLRVMWQPDHLVRVGVETGKMQFLSYRFKDSVGNDGRIIVNAVPLLVEWSMAVSKRFQVFAGSGVYFLTTKMDYAGKSRSNKLSIGWMAAISYLHPLGKDLNLGTELKWMDAAETTDGSLGFQLQLVYRFLKW